MPRANRKNIKGLRPKTLPTSPFTYLLCAFAPLRAQISGGRTKPPAGERGITPRETQQRATAGAVVLEPDERGGAIIVANDGRGSHETVHSALRQRAATGRTRVLPIRPWGTMLPLRRHGRRSLPLPLSVGVGNARRQTSTGHQAEARSEALTAHRTRCGRACNRYGSLCQVCCATRSPTSIAVVHKN